MNDKTAYEIMKKIWPAQLSKEEFESRPIQEIVMERVGEVFELEFMALDLMMITGLSSSELDPFLKRWLPKQEDWRAAMRSLAFSAIEEGDPAWLQKIRPKETKVLGVIQNGR